MVNASYVTRLSLLRVDSRIFVHKMIGHVLNDKTWKHLQKSAPYFLRYEDLDVSTQIWLILQVSRSRFVNLFCSDIRIQARRVCLVCALAAMETDGNSVGQRR